MRRLRVYYPEKAGFNPMEAMIRFVLWAQQLSRDVPLPEQIMVRFKVSRATAYRWIEQWRMANGIPTPPPLRARRKPTPTEIKEALRYTDATSQTRRCAFCAHASEHGQGYWLWCQRHSVSVRTAGICPTFEKKREEQ